MSRRDYYYKYLESDHWQQLRAQVFERDSHKCLHCGSPKHLRGHHVIYRKNLEKCTPKDIMTLCDSCHHKEHIRMNENRRKKRALRKGLNRRQFRKIRWLTNLILSFDAH